MKGLIILMFKKKKSLIVTVVVLAFSSPESWYELKARLVSFKKIPDHLFSDSKSRSIHIYRSLYRHTDMQRSSQCLPLALLPRRVEELLMHK